MCRYNTDDTISSYRSLMRNGRSNSRKQTGGRYRSIWISDIHLGTRGCKADFLIDFLRYNESEYLYLVGDIVDGWRLQKSWYWAQSHNDVVQKLLRKARKGTRVTYIPGNHDEWLRDYVDLEFGGITLREDVVHITADGKRLLILHGDRFDGIVKYARWLALIGDWAYSLALWLNFYLNLLRRRLDYTYWSLSAYLKGRVKNAVQFVACFAEAVPHGRDPRHRRRALLQRRRLGRELHRSRRAFRRTFGDRALD